VNQFQGLGDLVHSTRMIMTSRSAWPVCALIKYIAIYICFEFNYRFPTTRASMNAFMKFVVFNISNKAKNHCFIRMRRNPKTLMFL